MAAEKIDFNDGVNLAVMIRLETSTRFTQTTKST